MNDNRFNSIDHGTSDDQWRVRGTAATTPSVDAASRVLAGDDGTNYDPVAVSLHWTTAVLVVVQMLLAQIWGLFARPTRHLLITGHMSLGILLTAVIVARLAWRWLPGHQVPAVGGAVVQLASKTLHYLLYLLLLGQAALGFMLRWSGGEAMSFFGLMIASPFSPLSRAAHHQIGEFHEKVGWAIIILAIGHAAAALYHHYVLRDRVLLRMLPGHGA